jgi:3-oxoacyl-[acyl-carrier protein] reductase
VDLGISGRTALITGASRGLGRQCALALAAEGVDLALCARGQDQLDETVADLRALGAKAVGVAIDVTDPDARTQLVGEAVNELGPIDILVNNVGGSAGGATGVDDTGGEELLWAFDANLFAAEHLVRLVVPAMRKRQWGRLISIASIYGREHGGRLGYMAAKAALIAATKHHAIELAADGVTCNSVAPGSIRLPGGVWDRFIQDNSPEYVAAFIEANMPRGEFGTPEPVGDLVAYLASERAGLITGACINIDGGQSHSLI